MLSLTPSYAAFVSHSCNHNILLPYRRRSRAGLDDREPSSKSCAPGSLGSSVGSKVIANVVCPLLPQLCASVLTITSQGRRRPAYTSPSDVPCRQGTIAFCPCRAARLTSSSLLLQTHVAGPATWHVMRSSHLSSQLQIFDAHTDLAGAGASGMGGIGKGR